MSNLAARLLVALAGIPLLLACAWFGGYPLWCLVLLLQLLILNEWKGLLLKTGTAISHTRVLILLAALYMVALSGISESFLPFSLALVVIWLFAAVFQYQIKRLSVLGGELVYVVYIALPLVLWPLLQDLEAGNRFTAAGPLILLFTATWFCDSGAYFTGRAWGRHKLYERASPNKTVEGAVGGLLCSALPLLLVKFIGWGSPQLADLFVLPVAVGIFGQAGDLFESLLKREANVKDSSQLLPGHGGLLDRFDSLLFSTPIFYSYLLFIR